jgi:5-formyltetrahydrofolate cyclo-ligase
MSKKQKEAVRNALLEKRKSLDQAFVFEKSKQIFDKLKTCDEFKHAQHILLYAAYRGEVLTKDIISEIISTGRKAYLPVLISKGEFMACEVDDNLKPNKYGILEPTHENQREHFDLIICPGVAFDFLLNRLGFGGGYYDRFLLKRQDVYKIGLAYDFQIVKSVYAKKHDVAMDMIISEKRILSL